MIRLSTIYDNAMLYKDLTQWIRTKTFITLFIGLLSFGEFGALLFSYADFDGDPSGGFAFGYLSMLLGVYMVIIAFNGMAHTGKEFGNRTFELYEVAGMSLEKMVFGKFSSMLAQFLFGFFCIVPFMFFCYLLGGLDFFTILGTILVMAFAVPMMFILFLLFAFLRKGKGMTVLVRVIGFFGLVFMLMIGGQLFIALAFAGMGPGFGGGPSASGLINWLLTFSFEMAVVLITFLAIYSLIGLLMFYACCHNICPASDSRETAIKFLTTLLCIAWMAWVVIMHTYSPGVGVEVKLILQIPVAIVMLALGLIFYYTPLRVPRMALNRARSRFVVLRIVHYLFQPGPTGTLRTLLVLIACSLVGVQSIGGADRETLRVASVALQVPFFLVFPAGLLLNFRQLSQRIGAFRGGVFVWWGLTFAMLLVLATMSEFIWHDNRLEGLFAFAGLLVSPFSTMMFGWQTHDAVYEFAPAIRLVTGLAGILLMTATISKRRKLEETVRAAGGAPAAPALPSPAPPPPTADQPTESKQQDGGSGI
jgi:hypothetical protein